MKFERRKTIHRDEFARFLSDSARKILEENKVIVDGVEITLPESFEIELEYKEKKGYAKFEIEVVWDITKFNPPLPVAMLRGNGSPAPFSKGGASLALSEAKKGGIKTASVLPETFKEIKKTMERRLFEMGNTLKMGQPLAELAERDLTYFLDLVHAFRQKAKPEWMSSIDELQAAAERLNRAIESKNLSLAADGIRELNDIKDRCHQIFK